MKGYINLTHATQGAVSINKAAIFAVYAAKTNVTHIVSIGGNYLPVLESKEEVVSALEQIETPIKGEPINVKRRTQQRHHDSLSVNNPKEKQKRRRPNNPLREPRPSGSIGSGVESN